MPIGRCTCGVTGKLLIGAGESSSCSCCLSSLSSVCPWGVSWELDCSLYQEWIYSLQLWGRNGVYLLRQGCKQLQKMNLLAGVTRASTRAYNTRGNYFLPAREMTSTAAWSLSSETLGISHYFCYEINEHIMVLSLKGNSRDVGERDKVLLWIPFVSLLVMAFSILPPCYTSTDWNLHWFWLCSFEMWQYIPLVNISLSALQIPAATQPKSFELLGRVSWCASGCFFNSGFPVNTLKPKQCCRPSFTQWACLNSLILFHWISDKHWFIGEGVVVFHKKLFFCFWHTRMRSKSL